MHVIRCFIKFITVRRISARSMLCRQHNIFLCSDHPNKVNPIFAHTNLSKYSLLNLAIRMPCQMIFLSHGITRLFQISLFPFFHKTRVTVTLCMSSGLYPSYPFVVPMFIVLPSCSTTFQNIAAFCALLPMCCIYMNSSLCNAQKGPSGK